MQTFRSLIELDIYDVPKNEKTASNAQASVLKVFVDLAGKKWPVVIVVVVSDKRVNIFKMDT